MRATASVRTVEDIRGFWSLLFSGYTSLTHVLVSASPLAVSVSGLLQEGWEFLMARRHGSKTQEVGCLPLNQEHEAEEIKCE